MTEPQGAVARRPVPYAPGEPLSDSRSSHHHAHSTPDPDPRRPRPRRRLRGRGRHDWHPTRPAGHDRPRHDRLRHDRRGRHPSHPCRPRRANPGGHRGDRRRRRSSTGRGHRAPGLLRGAGQHRRHRRVQQHVRCLHPRGRHAHRPQPRLDDDGLRTGTDGPGRLDQLPSSAKASMSPSTARRSPSPAAPPSSPSPMRRRGPPTRASSAPCGPSPTWSRRVGAR